MKYGNDFDETAGAPTERRLAAGSRPARATAQASSSSGFGGFRFGGGFGFGLGGASSSSSMKYGQYGASSSAAGGASAGYGAGAGGAAGSPVKGKAKPEDSKAVRELEKELAAYKKELEKRNSRIKQLEKVGMERRHTLSTLCTNVSVD